MRKFKRRKGLTFIDQVRNKSSEGKITANAVFDALVANFGATSGRPGLGALLDQDGKRDLDAECKYPTVLTPDVYRSLYQRVGIAKKANNVFSDECWSVKANIYETEKPGYTPWEKAFNTFRDKYKPDHYLHRFDRINGLMSYGGLLIGLNDGRSLDKPVAGIAPDGTKVPRRGKALPRKVLYHRPLAQDQCTVIRVENDPTNQRFGQPLYYDVMLDSSMDGTPSMLSALEDDSRSISGKKIRVHWTRIVHGFDGPESSEWIGTPRLEPIVNMIYDCRKVLGSAAEMFYKGGFFGLSFETNPGLNDFFEIDMDELKEEIDAFQNGLQRYIRLVNMQAKSLAPQVADPSNHMEWLIKLIAAVIGVPVRILLGAEAGNLASTQDSATWNRRLLLRNTDHVEPRIWRPYIDRLMLFDAIPTIPKYYVTWPDLNTQTEKERADVALKLTQALLQYVTSGAASLVAPKQFFTLVLRYSDDEAEAMIAHAGGEAKIKTALKDLVKKTAGNTPGTSGTNPSAKTGASGNRNGQARKRNTATKRVS